MSDIASSHELSPVADLDGKAGGEIMSSAGREHIMMAWGLCPPVMSRGQKPWLAGEGTKPPEAVHIFYNKWLSFEIKIQ